MVQYETLMIKLKSKCPKRLLWITPDIKLKTFREKYAIKTYLLGSFIKEKTIQPSKQTI